jgi:hypothetical protein
MYEDLMKNYQERRSQLAEKLSASKNQYLVSVIAHSIVVSDISMELVMEELTGLSSSFLDYQKKARARYEEIEKRAKKAVEDSVALKAQYGEEFDTSITDFAVEHTNATLKNIAMANQIEIDAFQSSIDIIIKSLNHFWAAENRRDVEEAFNELFKFIVGLTPIGPFLSLHEAIKKIRGTYSGDEKQSDKTLNEYQLYLEKLYLWNILAQTIVERFKALVTNEDEPLEEEYFATKEKEAVEARFDNKLSGLQQSVNG